MGFFHVLYIKKIKKIIWTSKFRWPSSIELFAPFKGWPCGSPHLIQTVHLLPFSNPSSSPSATNSFFPYLILILSLIFVSSLSRLPISPLNLPFSAVADDHLPRRSYLYLRQPPPIKVVTLSPTAMNDDTTVEGVYIVFLVLRFSPSSFNFYYAFINNNTINWHIFVNYQWQLITIQQLHIISHNSS